MPESWFFSARKENALSTLYLTVLTKQFQTLKGFILKLY